MLALDRKLRRYKAVENLYHRYLTGLILRTIVMRGTADAANLVFQLFRRQQLEKFLPGVEKLGLSHLPDAVKCAQYHYLSNAIGSVKVEYIPESDKKAWVRYPPPRWIWDGTAIAAIPTDVSRAMLRAWHANNWALLKNPRLGFVCTKQTVDGQPGLESYFIEHDRELAPDERFRFAPNEEAPDADPAQQPRLGADWPEDRVRKALRNYAMEYVRNILPEMVALFGPDEAQNLGRATAKLIGMHYYDETAQLLGVEDDSPEAFASFMAQFGQSEGGDTVADGTIVRQTGWRLMRDLPDQHEACFDAWNGLWEGMLAAHNRRLRLRVTARADQGDSHWEWRIR